MADDRAGNGKAGARGREGIFISYRRADEPVLARRLYDALSQEFGKGHVFMDVDSIDLGLDFVTVLSRAMQSCTAMIVVIGSKWLNARDSRGRRRLDDANDYVRLEIDTALRRNIRVIPVLVDGEQMPPPEELPEPLRPLSRRNAQEISSMRYRAGVKKLVPAIRRALNDANNADRSLKSAADWRASSTVTPNVPRTIGATVADARRVDVVEIDEYARDVTEGAIWV